MAEANLTPDYKYLLTEVIRVIDGDTIEAKVSRDVGFYLTVSWDLHLRIEGVNCPETKGQSKKAGLEAAEFTKNWLEGRSCIVETVAKVPGRATGKTTFERWVAKIVDGDGESLSDALVKAGHANLLRSN